MDEYYNRRWTNNNNEYNYNYNYNNYNGEEFQQQAVPVFGRWDYEEDDVPYTQCFETATNNQHQHQHQPPAGLIRYGSNNNNNTGGGGGGGECDRDLYVAGDLYQNDILTPAVILVPRPRRKGGIMRYPNANGKQGEKRQETKVGKHQNIYKGYSCSYEYDNDIKEPPSPIVSPPRVRPTRSKPVDEDLYKIPPEFLHIKPKRKRGLGLFSSCLLPACV